MLVQLSYMHTEASERGWYSQRDDESSQERAKRETTERFYVAQDALSSGRYLPDEERTRHQNTIREISQMPSREPERDYLNEF